MEKIELTTQQEEAKDKIVEWFNDPNKKQIFVLSGYAGTGKTFLINHIINNILELDQSDVAFVTPTGKAASILMQKGQEASTVHRLIYIPVVEDDEFAKDKKTDKKSKRKLNFVKRTSIPYYKLIVLDEISMVPADIMKDLLSYGIPILCSGDDFQLPAIGLSNNLLDNPDFTLTEIVRQSLENPIIQVATMARLGEEIPFGNYDNKVIVVPKESLNQTDLENLYLKTDQIIVGTNRTRKEINDTVRRLNGIDVERYPLPIDGEKIICVANNWEVSIGGEDKFNLMNGLIGTVKDVNIVNFDDGIGLLKFRADFLNEYSDDLPFDISVFRDGDFKHDIWQKVTVTTDGEYIIRKEIKSFSKDSGKTVEEYLSEMKDEIELNRKVIGKEPLNRFEFGYAISCHKSQGSEFNKVLVLDESSFFAESDKWLYTAITRAKERLVIVR